MSNVVNLSTYIQYLVKIWKYIVSSLDISSIYSKKLWIEEPLLKKDTNIIIYLVLTNNHISKNQTYMHPHERDNTRENRAGEKRRSSTQINWPESFSKAFYIEKSQVGEECMRASIYLGSALTEYRRINACSYRNGRKGMLVRTPPTR